MKYVVFSDVHGNLEALERFAQRADEKGADQMVCLGDIVGYGADPNACVEFVRDRGVPCVSGNHDDVVSGLVEPDDFNPDARRAILWCRERISPRNRRFLRALEQRIVIETPRGRTLFVHGSPADKDEYIMSGWSAMKSFGLMEREDFCCAFVGHTHQPCVWVWKAGERVGLAPYSRQHSVFSISPELRLIVNVGSVGQPRDGDPEGCFVVWDDEAGSVEFVRFGYDVAKAQEKIIRANLPLFLADRLAGGY
ncbi:MAG: metallophosphoesterase family protein [bacterium]